jgi:hypothetical protein
MPDLVGTALASIATGAAAGAAIMTTGVALLRTAQATTGEGFAVDTGFLILSAGVVLGIVAAAAAGWLLAHPIDDYWRRGVVAALSVFGACLLAMVAAPADIVAGRIGLTAYLVVLVVVALFARSAARRAGSG